MINSIYIKNFLSHKESRLDFDPGVNIIVGPSDAGKSAVIRALNWLVYNRPLGDSYRSHWGGDTEVSADMEEASVYRNKTDKESIYALYMDPDDDPLVFKAFKTEVPEEIIKAFNLDAANIQGQFDAHFLLRNSPGEVAQYFNTIANLDKIDLANNNINSWVRAINQDIKADEKNLQEQLEELKQYSYLKDLESQLEKIETRQSVVDTLTNNIAILQKRIQSVREIEQKLEGEQKILNLDDDLLYLANLQEEKKEVEKDKFKLNLLLNSITKLNAKTDDFYDLDNFEKSLDKIIKLQEKKSTIENDWKNLDKLMDSIFNLQIRISKGATIIEELEEEFHEYVGEVCPLCGEGKIKDI